MADFVGGEGLQDGEDFDGQGVSEFRDLQAVGTEYAEVNLFDTSQSPVDGALGITGAPDAIQLRNVDDAGTVSEQRSRLTWHNDSYEQLGTIAGDVGDGEISIYTRDDAFGSGNNRLEKRLDIGAESAATEVRWRNISKWVQAGAVGHGTTGVVRISADAGQGTELQFYEDGSAAASVVYNAGSGINQAGQLVLNNASANGARINLEDTLMDLHETVRIRTDINMNGNPLRGIRQGSNLGASDLNDGELAFDDNRGGTGNAALIFREADNTTHYLDFDGTL